MKILSALCTGEQHAFSLLRELARGTWTSPGAGELFGALDRLLEDGLIEQAPGRIDPALGGKLRPYYRITSHGRRTLAAEELREPRPGTELFGATLGRVDA